MRRLAALFVLLALLLAGCGGSAETAGTAASAPTGGMGTGPAPSGNTDLGAAASCPTTATRSFAKTRFVADVGGAAFLVRRYIYQPYQAGSFTEGADGRTLALVKAAAAAAASAKLLNNATENAKADPTLCKTVAGPLSSLSTTLSGLTSSLRSGNLNPALLGGLGGAVTGLLDKTGQAGVPVQEKPVDLG